ncbi:alpha/beta hydrolase fold domain-containing protein [Microvirga tunisiensis]|uniref:Alpha/beta hydrolase fold domain-containing protein n=2 Tax=Pannonibacter tanglangensis TaxID=2750084 RepID=A0ABW9ZML0_9HYPH|nr:MULTISPECIES: alpha/beta hydrolase [unclassified Pannonibacter]NBN64259.1 alpha/beta hydrolase fold domain-containing protein [Pannonibacter sp. XCT-34]NBN78792.1 alpha/beta hydrolase fold domain-containing protein [Pannonibacter sp. XCT-53]
MLTLDPALFSPEAVAEETATFNRELAARLGALPDQWSFPPQVVRDRREQGLGPFPAPERSPRARVQVIDGPHGPVPLRIIAPLQPGDGAFLHIHGGGWTFGGADLQDARLVQMADRTGLTVVSVDYRLAPENPYPCGPDDCEAAALWLTGDGGDALGLRRFAIGGDSAGANLSAATLIRLRDRHGLTPFLAAVFIAGCFDLRLTPSARAWGSEKLVLNTRDLEMFVRHYLSRGHDAALPDVSPLLADLRGLPRAHFVVGTRDPLLDDTLFMAGRWVAAGNAAETRIVPGGCHVFQSFGLSIALESNNLIDNFLRVSMG